MLLPLNKSRVRTLKILTFFCFILDPLPTYTYICIIKQYNTMGQIKRLLEDLLLEEMYTFPDDFDMDYKSIDERQREAEYLAYEEMLSDKY